jgi:endonuclease/exonuclease/phosphatase family metal-dependent hydrolase
MWATGPEDAMAEPPRALRYVTLNVLHGGVFSGLSGDDQDLDARLAMVVEALRALDPDVVGLQEASVGGRRGHVAARLADQLGLHYTWAPALLRVFPFEWLNTLAHRALNFSEGPAILSRFPIIEWEAHDLPRCNGLFDPRVLVYARLQTPWGDLGVASIHTSVGFCEARRVAELMLARRGALPSVLMGDFNATETSAGIQALTDEAGFRDTFRAANPGAPGATVWQNVYSPVPTVRRRVDFLFMLPGTAVAGRVLSSRIVLDAPGRRADGTVLWPSDHYGVFSELEVFPPTGVAREGGSGPVEPAAASPPRPGRRPGAGPSRGGGDDRLH